MSAIKAGTSHLMTLKTDGQLTFFSIFVLFCNAYYQKILIGSSWASTRVQI